MGACSVDVEGPEIQGSQVRDEASFFPWEGSNLLILAVNLSAAIWGYMPKMWAGKRPWKNRKYGPGYLGKASWRG